MIVSYIEEVSVDIIFDVLLSKISEDNHQAEVVEDALLASSIDEDYVNVSIIEEL